MKPNNVVKPKKIVHYTKFASPLGELLLAGNEDGLSGLYLPTGRHARQPLDTWTREESSFTEVVRQLGQYFAGQRREFDLKLNPAGTDFQRRVWQALRDIPYGTTASYGHTAAAIGAPGSARAVGLANGQNPISIIVACHRVIGADGSLTGYGGGLEAKRWLLAHEQAHSDAGLPVLF